MDNYHCCDNEGICHYSVEFPAVLLEKTEKGRYHLINSKSARADILGEEILSTLTFFSVKEVSFLEDQFTLAILGRFLSQTFNFVPKNS